MLPEKNECLQRQRHSRLLQTNVVSLEVTSVSGIMKGSQRVLNGPRCQWFKLWRLSKLKIRNSSRKREIDAGRGPWVLPSLSSRTTLLNSRNMSSRQRRKSAVAWSGQVHLPKLSTWWPKHGRKLKPNYSNINLSRQRNHTRLKREKLLITPSRIR